MSKCINGIGNITRKANGTVTYECIFRKGVLFRKFGKDSGRETLQLVLPKKFRGTVLAVAHDWIMSEHQGGKKYS